jgi:ABC-2 type transport system ATP-binding protein
LRGLLVAPDVTVEALDPGSLEVPRAHRSADRDVRAANGIALHELTPQQASLEEAFMDLTREEIEFKAAELEPEEAVA